MTTGTLFFRIFVVLFATFISVGFYIYLQSLSAILILLVGFLTYIIFRGTELEYEYVDVFYDFQTSRKGSTFFRLSERDAIYLL